MDKNRIKKISIISILMAVIVYATVFYGTRIQQFSSIREQTGVIYDTTKPTYILAVRYMYADGSLAGSRDVYSYVDGENINITIPPKDGYTASVEKIEYTVNDSFLKNIGMQPNIKILKEEDKNLYRIEYNIIYNPSASSYKIKRYMMNMDREYELVEDTTYTDNVFVGDHIKADFSAKYEGYTLNRQVSTLEEVVNKDGTTELKLYYDRNLHHIYVYPNGGSYYDPRPRAYGAAVYPDGLKMERPGYEFDGWDILDGPNGNVIGNEVPTVMPDHDIYVRAKWKKANAGFSITYFVEDAEDDDYTNMGIYYVNDVPTEAKISELEGLDEYIRQGLAQIIGSDEANYFELNNELSNVEIQNAVVSGDSTTNIDIYIDRKEYTVRFTVAREYTSGKRTYNQVVVMTNINKDYTTWKQINTTPKIIIVGKEYGLDEYSITAKYGENIRDRWPTADTISNDPKYSFITWRADEDSPYFKQKSQYSTSRLVFGIYPNMSKELIIDPKDSSREHVMTAMWFSGPVGFKVHYMFEALDQTQDTGSTYTNPDTHETKYYEEFMSTSIKYQANVAENLEGPQSIGYKYIGKYSTASKGSKTNPPDIYFYYDRNDYTVRLYNVNGIYTPNSLDENLKNAGFYLENGVIKAKYMSNIKALENAYIEWEQDVGNRFEYPVQTAETKKRVFGGWYEGPSYNVPVDWENTIITDSTTLYAKWLPPDFDITFNTDGGTWNETSTEYTKVDDNNYSLNVVSETTLTRPAEPTKKGYNFKGWYYTDSNGEYVEYMFSKSQKIYSDMELKAEWEPAYEGKYTVKYVLGQYDGNGNLITNINAYENPTYLAPDKVVEDVRIGSSIVEEAIEIPNNQNLMYLADKDKKVINIETDKNVTEYFFYTPRQKVAYTIYYLKESGKRYENGEIPPEDEFLADPRLEEVTVTNYKNITAPAKEIIGYDADAIEKSLKLEITTSTPNASNNAIFFYYSPVENKAEYEINYYFMKEDGTYSSTPDYVANGEDSVGKEIEVTDYYKYLSKDSELYNSHELDKDKTALLYGILTTGNKLSLNLYFKNKEYTVTFYTDGGEWTDTSDKYTQMSAELYGTELKYHSPIPQPSRPTKEGYKFDGWYDATNDRMLDFTELVEEDMDVIAKWREVKNITIRKVWQDNHNQDGKRPDKIILNINANGETIANALLDETTSWNKTIHELLVKDSNDEDIVYTVTEETVEGYEATYSNSGNNYTITNKHSPETKEINVSKVWKDNSNQDGKRPQNVVVNIKNGDVIQESVTLNEENNWNGKVRVSVYANGEEITYIAQEEYIVGYDTSYSYDGNNIVVTNTHTPETKNITITKVWKDNNNQDGKRPESVTVNIKKGNETFRTVVIPNTTGNVELIGMPVYENGQQINYTVEEVAVNGYEVGYEYNGNNIVVTNTHTPETKQISITKKWVDKINQDGIRPESVNVTLKEDGVFLREVNIKSSENWTNTIDNLPVYKNGNEIIYTVEEEKTTGYDTSVTQNGNTYIVTNTHETETTTMSVNKTWVDNNNQDGKRPENLEVRLLANGIVVDTQNLNEANNWKYSWNTLDKNKLGSEITYTVEEANVDGYTATHEYNELTREYSFVNTHEIEKREYTVTKVWVDDSNRDGKRPENLKISLNFDGVESRFVTLDDTNSWTAKFENVDVYANGQKINYSITEEDVPEYISEVNNEGNTYTFTNTHIPERKDLTVTKEWLDGNNKDHTRKDSMSYILYKNGEAITEETTLTIADSEGDDGIWLKHYPNMYVYENGKKIDYTVKEINIPEGYGPIYNQEKLIIFNVYPPAIEVIATKVWNDDNDADGYRPESVQVQLNANGVPYVIGEQNIGLITLSDEKNWTYTWPLLQKYDNNGERIIYTVDEVNTGVPQYTTTIKNIDEGTFNEEFQKHYVITNTYTPEKTNKIVKKVWSDNNDQDGMRPENVKVHLLANGNEVGTADLNATNNWEYTFEDVNLNEHGQVINYTVTEDTIDGYTPETSLEDETLVITNKHEPLKKSIVIKKEWLDNENQDGKRPDTVEVTLKADGEVKAKFNIEAKNGWTTTVGDLDVYKNGKEINYTIEESKVEDYEITYSKARNEYSIVNTHIPEKIDLSFEKVWQDDNNRDGIRPTNIVLTLKANGEEANNNIVLNRTNNWKENISGLDKYKNGTEITYSISENAIQGYSSTSEFEKNKFIITNTHTPETKNMAISKIWEDNNNEFNIRPDSIELELYANDKLLQKITLNEAAAYKTVIGGLYQKENGKNIVYSVKENEIDKYETTTIVTKNAIEVTNTLKIYNIKAKVEGIGGTISGKDLNPYERVIHNEANTKDIVITPDEGYKITNIKVNGKDVELPQDKTKPYTLPKFNNVKEDKEAVVKFEKQEFKLTTEVVGGHGTITGEGQDPLEYVKYGENSKNSIVFIPDEGNEISMITINGVDQLLPDNPRDAYTLDSVRNIREDTHVTVKYKKTEGKVIVKYETVTGKNIIDDIEINGYIGDSYKTEEKSFKDYVLVNKTDNTSGTMDDTETIVKYTYQYRPNIYVKNIVKGNYASAEKEFTFDIKITNSDGTEYTDNEELKYKIEDENGNVISTGTLPKGNATVKLKHNQKVVLDSIKASLRYSVTERPEKGYGLEINGETSTTRNISGQHIENTYIEFANSRNYISPTGVMLNVMPYGIGIIIVTLIVIIVVKVSKKHKDND